MRLRAIIEYDADLGELPEATNAKVLKVWEAETEYDGLVEIRGLYITDVRLWLDSDRTSTYHVETGVTSMGNAFLGEVHGMCQDVFKFMFSDDGFGDEWMLNLGLEA